MATDDKRAGPYQLFMLGLCVFALAALALEAVAPLDAQARRVLDIGDFAICIIFLVDFTHSLATAKNRLRYLVTWGWVDLLSSIPVLAAARWGRLARVLRILRLLRGVRATKILASFVLNRRAESMFLAAALVTLLLVVCSSIGVLEVERGVEGASVWSAEDALWWSVGTITTVGSGEKFPVTTEGRAIAVLLTTTGVALFGIFSGFVASWFLAPREREEVEDLEEIKKELVALRKALEGRKEPGGTQGTPSS
jgi:voltage-gated potassium channel